ncbi:MAG: hypothetical protein JJ863_06170 [Deltaproteobacteria bacterium]|nr:hypothetical protein [Deltaproteobacteria bacterium]
MRLHLLRGLPFAAALLTAGAIAQQGPSTISVDDIRPGMTGYGLTVFRGTEPERFDVEVIDVLHGFRPDQDLILIRTPHPRLEQTKAVGGMSGSPIYIDGKLAGAYAYGWPFGMEPIAGVTPISNMLHEMDRPYRPDSFPGAEVLTTRRMRPGGQARRRSGRHLAGLPAYRGEPTNAFAPMRAHVERRPPVSEHQMRPAATPIMLGGFTDEVATLLGNELEPMGWVPLQGGGGRRRQPAANTETRPRFVDGGAIGVQLVRGDVSATAIGTVTHVGNGHRLVGFGHPMMNAGEIGLPTSTARVLHFLASVARSFKIAEAEEPLGTLVHDRQAAIVVDTDLQPATIPMRIKINGLVAPPKDEWNVELASHRLLTPMLLFSTLANALKTSSSDQTDVMFTARYTVTIEGMDPITLSDRGYMGAGPGDVRALSHLRLFDLMEIAYGNAFEPSRLTRVDLELDVTFGDDTLTIVEATVPANEVDPGSTVDVRLRLRRYDESEVFRTIPVRIPERLAGEDVKIEINAGSRVGVEHAVPRNIQDLIRRVREDRYDATAVVAELKMPSRGLRFPGHVVRSLPRSALDALDRDSGTTERPFVTQVRQATDLGQVVLGDAALELTVRQRPRRR